MKYSNQCSWSWKTQTKESLADGAVSYAVWHFNTVILPFSVPGAPRLTQQSLIVLVQNKLCILTHECSQ